ncbi:MAG: lipopolysaccharide heptosyltransferase II [bacterium]
MNTPPKILIVRLSAIGDVIHSTPILHSLRRKFPEAYIAWAIEDKSSDIIINNALIDKIFVFPKQKWKNRGFNIKNLWEFFILIKKIRKEKFDIVIDLQELFKSAIIAFLSGAKRKIAHAGTREFASIFVNEKLPAHDNFDPDKLIIERYLEPAAYLGAPVDQVQFSLPPVSESAKIYIDKLLENIDKNKEIIIFSPATIWDSKHWLEKYWAELLEKLAPEYNIIFTGTEKDKELIARICRARDEQVNNTNQKSNYLSLAGKTNLFELIELFNRAKYLIAPDTGPAHIANATQKPSIIMLFGSTGFKRTPPFGEKHIALAAELPCQPCFKRKCPRSDNNMECMKQLSPEKILTFIEQRNRVY